MSRQRAKSYISKADTKAERLASTQCTEQIEPEQLTRGERYFEIFTMAALFSFGIYHSVLYFGHQIVPNSDFPCFFKTGQELLSFKIPSSFKRLPVVGLLQVLLSYLVGTEQPGLTAGWLLNALLHPFNVVLLWCIGKKIVGKSALWFALIAALNPWLIYLLTEPIAETTLLFFTLVSFYFIFKRSHWGYFFAAVTTMVRYEGAALIMAAFVMDMIYSTSRRERILALLYSAAAGLPLAIWLLGTAFNWQADKSHYLNVLFTKEYSKGFAEPVENRIGLVKHISLLWHVGFRPLLMPYIGAGKAFEQVFWGIAKITAVCSFVFGSLYGLYKRNWKILALFIFFVPYFLIHAHYPYPIPRYHATIFWIALLLC